MMIMLLLLLLSLLLSKRSVTVVVHITNATVTVVYKSVPITSILGIRIVSTARFGRSLSPQRLVGSSKKPPVAASRGATERATGGGVAHSYSSHSASVTSIEHVAIAGPTTHTTWLTASKCRRGRHHSLMLIATFGSVERRRGRRGGGCGVVDGIWTDSGGLRVVEGMIMMRESQIDGG